MNGSSSESKQGMSTKIEIPTLKIYEDFDKIIAKEVYFTDSGEKIIVSFLNFTNICPEDQARLLMSDDSGEELYQSDEHHSSDNGQSTPGKPRKKSTSKRMLDQRKASLNKLHSSQSSHNSESKSDDPDSSPNDPTIAGHKPTCSSTKHHHHHNNHHRSHGYHRTSSKTHQSGYEKYQMSLLEVPMSRDYCDPSSDDLSTDWDSDAAAVDGSKTDGSATKEPKVSFWIFLLNFDSLRL